MPHLKVKPFPLEKLDNLIENENMLKFRAFDIDGNSELLYINGEKEHAPFFLELRKKENEWLIRPDKITRPLNVSRIKKVLSELSKKAELDIIHSNIDERPKKAKIAVEYDKTIEDFDNPVFPKERVALEVGFGSGRHLLYQAKRNPDILYIGIEIHTPSAQQLLKQIDLQGLDNIWVINYDARLLMEMLPSNSLENIYVHFPVPWDKKPHRRVINPLFVKEGMRILEQGGILELRTDSERYYRYSLDVFSTPEKVHFEVEKNKDIEVISKYEARWRRQEKNIYTLRLRSEEESADSKKNFNFSFEPLCRDGDWESLPKKALVENGFFVHFGKRYRRKDGKGWVIESASGSFDRPEHKYLLEEDGKWSYFPTIPVKIKANAKAHKMIKEVLHDKCN